MTGERGQMPGGEDHANLLSELDSHDLASATEIRDAGGPDAFAADSDADPDGTFPQSVASGGPTPEGEVALEAVTDEHGA